jgi:hypothetical protein
MRARTACAIGAIGVLVGGCGGKSTLFASPGPVQGVASKTPNAPQKLGFPGVATKNTTRVAGADPIADAAAVALAVFPSAAPGTHPQAAALAPTDDWQAAIAASSLMAPPIRAPLLLSDKGSLSSATSAALSVLAPTGSAYASGAQVIRVGDVPSPGGLRSSSISGGGPAELAAAIDRFESAARGKASVNVMIASTSSPAYAMPAAGLAAESGEPVLYVDSSGIPDATRQALLSHHRPHMYVLGPPSVIPDSVLAELRHYGFVKRVGASDPAANSVALAEYRDPPCSFGQACVHVPGSFGWAIRGPGHAYVLISANRTLDAAAASALSSSGGYGPQLVVDDPNTLPPAVLNYFLNYATPGYTTEGPTAAVYNHGWVIGDQSAISVGVQAQLDSLLEAVPQK